LLIYAFFAIAVSIFLACSSGDQAVERLGGTKVIILGIDAANWDVVDPLIAEGRLPNFAKLKAEGATGVLQSMDPSASPIIWTSIGTGKTPGKHGIRSFVTTTPTGKTVPVTSTMRRTKAVWNILSENDVTVGVIGWWATWPAEEVNGFMCSEYTWPLRKDNRGYVSGAREGLELSRRTYPRDLLTEVSDLIVLEESLPESIVRKQRLDVLPATGSISVSQMYCRDRSHWLMADYLAKKYDPEFFTVYFEGIDAFYHMHWVKYKYSRFVRKGEETIFTRLKESVDPQLAVEVGEVLDLYWEFMDGVLGRFMSSLDDSTTLMVVSDHGYATNPNREPIMRTYENTIRPIHWHSKEGMIAVYGNHVEPGKNIRYASVLDVTPTVLWLMGLPVADDMDGSPVLDAFQQEFARNWNRRTIPTYETPSDRTEDAEEAPFADEMIEQLKALGYID
jgi:predicted AlkP superfamily phosphohydrolase/phosphomutase